MRSRSLTTTLALAFAATTLAVFALVGSFVYYGLERQVRVQDDLDIVLAARHTRRLLDELHDFADIYTYRERLESQVLGNEALSIRIVDPSARLLLEHNLDADIARLPLPTERVPAMDKITPNAIAAFTANNGDPLRSLAADAQLKDGSIATVVITRNMRDRWLLLDHYRDRLWMVGIAGVLLTFGIGYVVVRNALKPLRDIAQNAGAVTVDRLDTRIAVKQVPSELEPLVMSLNSMLTGLERSFQRLSQFTADLAHDMRTPLANMRGATEVALARPRSGDEYQTLLASNLEECDRLSRMIENVLFLARAQHPQFARNAREFDVGAELQHIAEYFEGLAEEAGVHLRVQGSGLLKADVELFRRAVSNLLANAVRYTPRDASITLGAQQTPDALLVTVENEGTPIDSALLERIFDRFYRGDPSRTSGSTSSGSSGLGLAIVKTIMELHGGSVHAQSDARCTRFILTFPLPR
jgi:two-component system heavy metal sensor histidine kinase CusS